MVKRLALICCLLLGQTGHAEFSLLTFKYKKKRNAGSSLICLGLLTFLPVFVLPNGQPGFADETRASSSCVNAWVRVHVCARHAPISQAEG